MNSDNKQDNKNGVAQPLLALCMIVRDCEDTLERALTLPSRFCDEIVIVDTGSKDSTPEIAKAYATHYDEIEWSGFSDARNHALEMVTARFVLIMDSDEYFDSTIALRRLKMLCAHPETGACQIQIHSPMRGGGIQSYIWQTRLFRMSETNRYEGVVHNQIDGTLKRFCEREGLAFGRLEVGLQHTGYDLSPERQKAKYTARLPLLRQAVEDAQTPSALAYCLHNLAGGLFMSHDYKSAIEVYARVVEDDLNDAMRMGGRLMVVKAHIQVWHHRAEEGYEWDEAEAMRACRALAEEGDPYALAMAGGLMADVGYKKEALRVFLTAYVINSTPRTAGDIKSREQYAGREFQHRMDEEHLREIIISLYEALEDYEKSRSLTIGSASAACKLIGSYLQSLDLMDIAKGATKAVKTVKGKKPTKTLVEVD